MTVNTPTKQMTSKYADRPNGMMESFEHRNYKQIIKSHYAIEIEGKCHRYSPDKSPYEAIVRYSNCDWDRRLSDV